MCRNEVLENKVIKDLIGLGYRLDHIDHIGDSIWVNMALNEAMLVVEIRGVMVYVDGIPSDSFFDGLLDDIIDQYRKDVEDQEEEYDYE